MRGPQSAFEQLEDLSAVVELECLNGLKTEEMAALLGLSSATLKRDWALERAWLFQKIQA